jgi:diguanylate cyclase (GGDEF)-like protein
MKFGLSAISVLSLLCVLVSTTLWLDVTFIAIALVAIVAAIYSTKTTLLPFLMILAAIPMVPFVKWFEPAFETQSTEVAYRALNSELDIAEGIIQQFFQNNASALESIVVLVTQTEDIDNDLYQSWMRQILPAHRNQFLNVALSENLIITNGYPETEANLEIIGINLANVPGQGLLYRNAIAKKQNLVIGPVGLLQGVPGIIYVRPIPTAKNLVISGVLSLQFLKEDLEFLLSELVELDVIVSSATLDYRLMNNPPENVQQSVQRVLRFDEITVTLSAYSNQINTIISRTRIVTRVSAVAFWLAISLILALQHLNYRIREAQRKELERNKQELVAAQRLGQMGSWSSEEQDNFHLSDSLRELLGIEKTSLSYEEFISLVPSEEQTKVRMQLDKFLNGHSQTFMIEHQVKTVDQYHWFEHRIARNHTGQFTGMLRDIHVLKQRDEQVALLESFDSLTGAANRHYFKQLAIQNIAISERRRSTIALALVNIDGFRSINENHGQLLGDELLKQVTHRLQSSSRKSDSIARLSGDTFAISLVDIGKNKHSVLVIEQILRRLKEPYIISENIYPQFTMGVAMYPDDGEDYDTLLRMAESALSSAKSDARGHYRFYSAKLSEQTDRRQKILSGLPAAIQNNYLSLVFQPRVTSDERARTSSMEALVRWHDPILGFVSPGEFIPIAEQTSLIADIGYWVMEDVFRTISEYRNEIPQNITVSINLSPRQLEDAGLVRNVSKLLKKYDVNASQFEWEITEYSISGKSDAITNNMHQLNEMGFQFAMDDFGTGYSNLGILQSLPLNVLKVDMSFIRAIGTSQKSDELVKAILNMGHTLGLKVVAEGVESAEQVQFLRQLNCEELQGYYFFKPTPIDELLPSIRSKKTT